MIPALHMLLAPLAAFGFMHGPAHEAPKAPLPPHSPKQIERHLEKRADQLEKRADQFEKRAEKLEKRAERFEKRMENMSFDDMKAHALKMSTKALENIDERIEHTTNNDKLSDEKREKMLERLNDAKTKIEEVKAKIEAATSIDDLKAIKPVK